MAKLFGNLHLVMAVGLVLAIIVIMSFTGYTGDTTKDIVNDVFHWLHVFFGILWIGLLYYLNFVQVPTMPSIPAEQKGAINGHIAPKVLFYFRWAAMFTLITGLAIAFQNGFAIPALTFTGGDGNVMIGIGIWLAIIMFLNVWVIIWPAQKKILGIVEASAEEKAKVGPRALMASRTNTLLSLPMLYCMVNANLT